MSEGPLVTVVVPTHNHDETLEHSVRSILEQTVTELRVVIIGDGATPEVRSVAEHLSRTEERVRFEDHPKTPRHGEPLRDRVIRDADTRFIAYNGDDDLWLPHHLETLIGVIGEHDFVHPLPILIGGDTEAVFLPSDLQNPASAAWHLGSTPRNSISLTGVMHTRDAYLRLPHGWRETPAGRWTDHYMWQQFLEQEWFSGVTSPYATTLKLTAQTRDHTPPGTRRADIERWWNRMHDPGFPNDWDRMVATAVRRAAVERTVLVAAHEDELARVRRELRASLTELEETRTALTGSNIALDAALAEVRAGHRTERHLADSLDSERRRLDAMRASFSWRITRPLRAARRLSRRVLRPRQPANR